MFYGTHLLGESGMWICNKSLPLAGVPQLYSKKGFTDRRGAIGRGARHRETKREVPFGVLQAVARLIPFGGFLDGAPYGPRSVSESFQPGLVTLE